MFQCTGEQDTMEESCIVGPKIPTSVLKAIVDSNPSTDTQLKRYICASKELKSRQLEIVEYYKHREYMLETDVSRLEMERLRIRAENARLEAKIVQLEKTVEENTRLEAKICELKIVISEKKSKLRNAVRLLADAPNVTEMTDTETKTNKIILSREKVLLLPELLSKIVQYLPMPYIYQARGVNAFWQAVIDDLPTPNRLWQKHTVAVQQAKYKKHHREEDDLEICSGIMFGEEKFNYVNITPDSFILESLNGVAQGFNAADTYIITAPDGLGLVPVQPALLNDVLFVRPALKHLTVRVRYSLPPEPYVFFPETSEQIFNLQDNTGIRLGDVLSVLLKGISGSAIRTEDTMWLAMFKSLLIHRNRTGGTLTMVLGGLLCRDLGVDTSN